jgi:type I restriction enzyme R subunit
MGNSMKPYFEAAFETAIEHHLTTVGGYVKGDREAFDPVRALFPADVTAFIQATQPKEWAYLVNLHKDKAEETLLDDLCRALGSDHQGCLSVLRHGFKCFGKLFRVAYFAPASGMNPETQKWYEANRLTITRQLRYSAKHGNTLDVTLALNGIPVATLELKNPDRPGLAARDHPIQERPRFGGSDLPVQEAHAGPFRRGHRRSLHGHAAFGKKHPFFALQPGLRR